MNNKYNTGKLKIAVVVHVFYLDSVVDVLHYISNIAYQYELLFTVSDDNKNDLLSILENNNIKSYKIIPYPNKGYDIAPFLHILPWLFENNYDLICKIHTKKGPPHLKIFSHWLTHLMKPILGSENVATTIIESFEANANLGLVGSADFYKSAQALMYGNEHDVADILSTLNDEISPPSEWGFFAGTIFWARVKLFEPLLNNVELNALVDRQLNTEMDAGTPASVFHALERIIGALPHLTGMKTAVSDAVNKKRECFSVHLLPESFTPSSEGIHATLTRITSVRKNYFFSLL